MKVSEGFPKGILVLFAATAAVYFAAFYGIEHARSRKGPWTVGFLRDADGRPTLRIDQAGLGIENVRVVFPEETLPSEFRATNVTFEIPHEPPFALPVGNCFFEDLTTLPGTVTLRPFKGHEVEMLPRALFVNRKEYPWESGKTIEVFQTNRVPHLLKEDGGEGKR